MEEIMINEWESLIGNQNSTEANETSERSKKFTMTLCQ